MRQILTVKIIEDFLERYIDLPDPTGKILTVIIVIDRNKSDTHKRKNLFQIFPRFQMVSGKSADILHNDTCYLLRLHHIQKFLHPRTVHILTGISIILKLQDFHFLQFRDRTNMLIKERPLVGDTIAFIADIFILFGKPHVQRYLLHIFFAPFT